MKKIFNLKNLAYLNIMAMPLYLIKVSFLGVPTNVFEILALMTIVLFLSSAVGLKNELGGYREYFAPIVVIIAGLFLSTLYNEAHRSEWGIIKSWFIIPIIFSWVCARIFRENKEAIAKALYHSAFLVASVSWVYFFFGQLTFDGRLQAFYNSPNFLAMYLAPAIVIGLFLFKENIKFYAGSLFVITASLYHTQSYAAWLAVFVSIILLLIIQNKKEPEGWKKIAVIFFLAGAFFFLQRGTDKLGSWVQTGERSSTSSRLMIWRSAIKIGLDNPIMGIGPGNFQDKYLEYQKDSPPYLEWAAPQPHNLVLAFWLQTGLIGIVGFFWLIFIWIKKLFPLRNLQKENYIYAGIMIYILVHGLVDTTYFKNDLAVVFWLVIFATKKHPLPVKSVSRDLVPNAIARPVPFLSPEKN